MILFQGLAVLATGAYLGQFDTSSIWSTRVYYSPYCRFQTYGVGLLLGLAVHDIDTVKTWLRKFSYNPKICLLGAIWALGFTLGILGLYGCYPTANGVGQMSVGSAAMYNATFRLLWGIFVAVLILMCVLGYAGFINDILSSRFWIPFARVNYTTYVIHLILLIFFIQTSEKTFRFTTINFTVFVAGMLMCINCLGVVLSCFIEAPFIQLEKVLLGK